MTAHKRLLIETLLAYETAAVSGTPYSIRGLVLPGAKITLRELVEGLEVDSAELPEPFAKANPGLTIEDYRAGLYALRTLLHALEWSHHDTEQTDRYPPEKARAALASTLRALESYRRTGEP